MKPLLQRIYWLDPQNLYRASAPSLGRISGGVDYFTDGAKWLEQLKSVDVGSVAIISVVSSDEALRLVEDLGQRDVAIFWITKHVTQEQGRVFYESGGHELLIGDFDESELSAKVARYHQHYQKLRSMSAQLEEASKMALMAMDNSSDMGGILSFVKEALYEKEYQALAQSIFKYVHSFSKAALIEIKGARDMYYYCTEGDVSSELKLLLKHNKCETRIIRHKDILQINRDNFTVLVVGLPENDQEQFGRISDNMAIFADIADRFVVSIALEEQLRNTEKTKQAFLDTLGHELKTPLNAIMGFSKVLSKKDQDSVLGSSGKKAVDNIFNGAQQVNNIISTLMDISHAASNQQSWQPESLSVHDTITHVVKKLSVEIERNNNHVDINCPSNLTIFSEPVVVEKMIFQLVDNAVKFTQNGNVKILVTQRNSELLPWVDIKISDTGCGIERALQDKLFSSVGQLDQSHDRKHYGLGIGLFYVGVMSKFLRGEITFVSEEGVGSEFSLSIPSLVPYQSEDSNKENKESEGDCELF